MLIIMMHLCFGKEIFPYQEALSPQLVPINLFQIRKISSALIKLFFKETFLRNQYKKFQVGSIFQLYFINNLGCSQPSIK
jgi:hypothetical protein